MSRTDIGLSGSSFGRLHPKSILMRNEVRRFLKRFIFSLISVIFSIPFLAGFLIHSMFVDFVFAQSSAFTYEGRLFDASGVPVLDSVSVKFQILNPAGTCVLYEEVQDAVNLVSSKGAFSLEVGSVISDTKRSANFRGPYNPSMVSIFRNGTTLSSIPAAGCAAGTYTAGASDTRLLRVHVTKGSTTETLTPDLVITTAPYAQVAQSLQGFLPSDFLRLDVANGINGNIGLTATGTAAGQTREFRFYELAASGAEYSAFKAADAMATSLTYVLPSSAPAAGDVLKATVPSSGVVTLSWGADAGAGGGISNFNGSSQSSQSFTAVDIAAAVTAPAWSTNTGTGAHTLQIPMASGAGVTGGLITKTEHTAFSAKVDRAGDTMTGLLNFTGASGVSLAGTSGITFTGTGTIAMGTNKITGMSDPSAAQEAATKAYVDSQNSGKISGTLTATRIPFATAAATVSDDAALVWDNTAKNLGVGFSTPATKLDVSGTDTDGTFRVYDQTAVSGVTRSIVRAGAGQTTTNLMEWQNNAGTILSRIDSTGKFVGDGSLLTGVAGAVSGLTAGRVALSTAATTVGDSANFTFNSTTGAIGIGGTAPSITSGDAITIAAGGTNKNVELTPSGTGYTLLNGNVGIGTTSPGSKLEVVGNISATGAGSNITASNFVIGDSIRANGFGNATDPAFQSGTGNHSGLFFVGSDLAISTNSTERVRVLGSNGNVGIGTTTPVDPISIGTAVTASATRALVNLSNTAMVAGNASGTYLGVNAPAAYAGDFLNFQINGTSSMRAYAIGGINFINLGELGSIGTVSNLQFTTAQANTAVAFKPVSQAYASVGIWGDTASTQRGTLSVGSSGAWNGVAGQFAGSADGTLIAGNKASGYLGNLVDLQVDGVSKFRVDKDGKVYGDGSGLTGISGAVSGLTAGRVTLSTAATTVADSANFTFNTTTGAMDIGGTAPSITSGDTLTLAAGGTNKNVVVTPSGTGYTVLNGKVGIRTASPLADTHMVGSDGVASFGVHRSNVAHQRDFLIESANDSLIQLVSDNWGNDGSGIVMTGMENASDGRHWTIQNKGTLQANRFSIGYLTTTADNQAALTAGTERFVISTAGNVGIGTTGPATKLDVVAAAGDSHVFSVTNTSATIGWSGSFNLAAPNLANGERLFANIGKAGSNYNRANIAYAHVGDGDLTNRFSIGFFGASDLLNVLANGNVGIGTTTPDLLLTIAPPANAPATMGLKSSGGAGAAIGFGYSGTYSAAIAYNDAVANALSFRTAGTTSGFDRMTLTSSGNLGIGTTGPNEKLEVNGNIRLTPLNGGGTTTATIDNNGNIIRTPSDERLKTQIQPLEGSLERILKVQGVSYYWKNQESFGSAKDIGFIAQDLEKVVPEVVRQSQDPEHRRSVSYANMVALLVEALKEMYLDVTGHSRDIASLRNENASLKSDNIELKTEVDALKSWACSQSSKPSFCK